MMALRPPAAGEPGPPEFAAYASESANITISMRSRFNPAALMAPAYTMTNSGMVNATNACSEMKEQVMENNGMNTSSNSGRLFAGPSNSRPIRRSNPVFVIALASARTPKMKMTASLANACAIASGLNTSNRYSASATKNVVTATGTAPVAQNSAPIRITPSITFAREAAPSGDKGTVTRFPSGPVVVASSFCFFP